MVAKKKLLDEAQIEHEVLIAFEKGELKSIPKVKAEIARTVKIFKASGKKIKRVNIRLTETDFEQTKEAF